MVTAKVTARGMHKGEPVVIECIEYDGEDKQLNLLFDEYIGRGYLQRMKLPHCYNPAKNSAEAYWLAMHEEYFDVTPKIEVEYRKRRKGRP